MFRDPSSPLAAARALSRAALKRDEAFAEGFADALAGKGAGPRESDVRRAYRREWRSSPSAALRAAREVALRPPRREAEGPRRAALGLTPGTPPEEIEAAVEASFNSLGDGLLAQLEEAGLPLLTPEGPDRLHFRATLVMPVPILRANACVTGDTAVWEFDEETSSAAASR